MQQHKPEQGKVSLFPHRPGAQQAQHQEAPEIDNLDGLVRQMMPEDSEERDIVVCRETCKHHGLNPMLKEINFLPQKLFERGREVWRTIPVVSRDGLLTLAHRSGKFSGMETKLYSKPWPMLKIERDQSGYPMKTWFEDVMQPVARTEVWRNDSDKPFVAEVGFWEYAVGNDGQILYFWQGKPVTMICKVSESQALRKAFHLPGLYIPEELNMGTADDGGVNLANHRPPKEQVSNNTQEQHWEENSQPVVDQQQSSQEQISLLEHRSEPEHLPPEPPEKPSQREDPRPFQHYKSLIADLTDAGIEDRTKEWDEIHSGEKKVTRDCFFGVTQPGKTIFYAWLVPGSPNHPLLDSLGFCEDPYQGWWSITFD